MLKISRQTHDPLAPPREALAAVRTRLNDESRPMAEMLPWLFPLDDRTLVNKDSSLMAIYEFVGPDTDTASTATMWSLLGDLSHALRALSRRPFHLWWLVERRKSSRYETLPMPDPVSQVVDDERKKAFEQSANYRNRHYVALSMPPQSGLNRFAGRFAHAMTNDQNMVQALTNALRGTFSDNHAFAYTTAELAAEAERFEQLLSGVIAGTPHLSFQRLSGDRLGAFIATAASPVVAPKHAVALATGQFLDDAYTDTMIDVGGDHLLMHAGGQRRYAFATGIPSHRENWPDTVDPTLLDGLLKLDGELTIAHVFRQASRSAQETQINGMKKYHSNRKLSPRKLISAGMNGGDTSTVDPDEAREEAEGDAKALLKNVAKGKKAYGWYNFTVMSYSPSFKRDAEALQAYEAGWDLAKSVDEVLTAGKWVPVREHEHVLSSFSATIPGMWKEIARWIWLDYDALARLLPLRSVSPGEPVNRHLTKEMRQRIPAIAAFPTEYGTPYYYTGFAGPLGHRLLVGGSRTGKTIFEALCWTLARKVPDSTVIILDKDGSNEIPIILQGGQYIDYTSGSRNQAKANPMRMLMPTGKKEWDDRNFAWLGNFIELLASQRKYEPTTQDRETLDKQLRATRDTFLSNGNKQILRLHTVLVQFPKGRFSEELAPWAGSGSLAHVFDNEEDAFAELTKSKTRLIGAEVGEILKNPLVATPMLDYLFHCANNLIESNAELGIVAPTLISLPEVHHLLKYKVFVGMLENWLKVLAKKLGQIGMDSQSAEDYVHSDLFPSIRDNVPIRIFLPKSQAEMTPSLIEAYRDGFGLNDSQMNLIQTSTIRRDYIIAQADGFTRRISLPLDERSVAILRSELSAKVLFNEIRHSGNPDWRQQYIDEAVRRAREDKERAERHHA